MVAEIEFEGTSEQDAVSKACAAFEMKSEEIDYTVVDEGSGGLFGIGSRPVRIRASAPEGFDPAKAKAHQTPATPVDKGDAEAKDGDQEKSDGKDRGGRVGPAPEKVAQAVEVAGTLLEKMGVDAKIESKDEEREIILTVLETSDESTSVADALAESRPPALPSLQFLLNKIVNRFPDDRKHIVVEAPSVEARLATKKQEQQEQRGQVRQVGEIPEDVDPELAALAQKLAERAVEINKVITIHPMPASDRRAIHQTIMTLQGVETVSEGDGLYRKMHIVPATLKKNGGGGGKRRRRRRRRGGKGGGRAEASAD